jgi:hypothetical protein
MPPVSLNVEAVEKPLFNDHDIAAADAAGR